MRFVDKRYFRRRSNDPFFWGPRLLLWTIRSSAAAAGKVPSFDEEALGHAAHAGADARTGA